ncbi:MAG: CRR6 family NdhI maturation factor [Cyanobacteria bacterium]|nr:CRR6 family NdhI maturation factor [Cyanobacteria bacterium CG_2015-16_32_12]NCO79282.1 CRR6 family NdhI maturation factor [Cyanobacteria bacterium CG_2015-22_32_23]NCQ05389.1 CRR6 family NdhI maturation factor [Cyanobacteria bacterium CG_2015-09_32_10]NCQ41646.1 CRR6 family NdhI maturation factor [Cyanobacteria bacterium CG_2015-04_32_10]NCS85595.1 CRR6 family NdhI maturation factor [Cyanobacteria bacterium CG_2015-02_32_10]
MTIDIKINANHINQLDLSPVEIVIKDLEKRQEILTLEQQIVFNIDYPQEENDPRELSEIPEIRLWFIALDSRYPWLPFCLNWRDGELARYTAMLVPHSFNRTEGIQYNSEALDIFIMGKTFILYTWLKQQNLKGNSRLKAMTQIFGYDLEDSFFELLSND